MRVSESYEYNLRRMSAQLDSTDVCEDVLMAVHAYRTLVSTCYTCRSRAWDANVKAGLVAHRSCILLPEGSYVFVQGGVEGLLHGDQPAQSCMRPVVYVQSRPAQKHMCH